MLGYQEGQESAPGCGYSPQRLLARQRGTITQGRTREEAREDLKDATHIMLEVMREDAEKDLEGKDVTREYIEV